MTTLGQQLTERATATDRPLASLIRQHTLDGLLRRLANSTQASRFLLRGGLLTRAWLGPERRTTDDADFLGLFPRDVEEALGRLGAPTWFRLGDRDMATHIRRTELLRGGARLTDVMQGLAAALGVRARLLPMCDETVATKVRTPEGLLDFQDYFVRRHHADRVLGLEFAGIEQARVTPEVRAALGAASTIVLCPSNPFVSLGPLRAVPGMNELLRESGAPLVAVSPIVAGQALRGPAAEMLAALGHEVSALGVAKLYQNLVRGFVLDEADRALVPAVEALGLRVLVTATVMTSPDDRRRLASDTLAFAETLR